MTDYDYNSNAEELAGALDDEGWEEDYDDDEPEDHGSAERTFEFEDGTELTESELRQYYAELDAQAEEETLDRYEAVLDNAEEVIDRPLFEAEQAWILEAFIEGGMPAAQDVLDRLDPQLSTSNDRAILLAQTMDDLKQ